MDSKAALKKHKSCPEFQGMTYDKTFQSPHVPLRKIVKEIEYDNGLDLGKRHSQSLLE